MKSRQISDDDLVQKAFFIFVEMFREQMCNLPALYDAWKIGVGSGWENVMKHCVIQAAVVRATGSFFGLVEHEIDLLVRTMLAHNSRKHWEKKGSQDFTPEEHEEAEQLLALLKPDKVIMERVLVPDFLDEWPKEVPVLHALAFMVDDYADEHRIVPFRKRIASVKKRNPHPNPPLEARWREPYWTRELRVCTDIQAKLRWEVEKRGRVVGANGNLPHFLRRETAEWVEQHFLVLRDRSPKATQVAEPQHC